MQYRCGLSPVGCRKSIRENRLGPVLPLPYFLREKIASHAETRASLFKQSDATYRNTGI